MRRILFLLSLVSCICISAQSSKEGELIDRYLMGNPSLEKLAEIADILRRNDRIEQLPLYHPLKGKGRVSSSYGMRRHPISGERKFHSGVDLAVTVGSSVHAAASGHVVFAGKKGGYGRCVIISHQYGYETIYAHLIAYYTKKGEIIRQGDVIGFVGSTGNSTGNHLHYGVKHRGKPEKPYLSISIWNRK